MGQDVTERSAAKVASWGGYLPLALRDPRGTANAAAVQAESFATPDVLLPKVAVSLISVALVIVMAGLGLREARLADPEHGRDLRLPLVLFGALELGLVTGW